MKRMVTVWVLVGVLAGSAAFNVYYVSTVAAAGTAFGTQKAVPAEQPRFVCPSAEELGLTEKQKQQITGCCGACTRQQIELERRINGLFVELERALNAEPVNEERVYELADQIADLRGRRFKSRVHSILLVRETLTRDQLERLVAAAKGP